MSWKDILAGLQDSGTLPPGDPEPNEAAQAEADAGKAETTSLPIRFFYEKKGRAGKPATIITGFDSLSDDELTRIASLLKQRLGCGGSARGGEILLQGDRRDRAREILIAEGYRIKK
ncbi:MAG: translation initiation factor [Muribaculaceae bacterium]|nr:translation initiation factor [Muribaculaceae bacterium]